MANKTKSQDDIASMSFEDAMSELENIVHALEKGEAPLEQTILAYEKGTRLRLHCETKLREAQARIDQIVSASGDTIPFESD